MPRNVLLIAERFLVDNASPGTRVAVMGVYSTFNSKGMGKSVGATNVRQPYIRIVGLRVLQGKEKERKGKERRGKKKRKEFCFCFIWWRSNLFPILYYQI